MKGRIRYFFDREISRLEIIDQGVAEIAGYKITRPKKGPALREMRIDKRRAIPAWNQREVGRNDPPADPAYGIGHRCEALGQGRDCVAFGAAARIGAVRVQKVVLHVD